MALATIEMTDEQRKSVAIDYLKASDKGGVTSTGGSILDLFADDAQVYFPKWALAAGSSRSANCSGMWAAASDRSSITTRTSTGSSPAAISSVCEGTSHGEHKDGT
jgi:hypothetical protein